MVANPSVVIDELIPRITSIVLRTYEVEQLLPDDSNERLSLARYELVSAVSTGTGHIDFSCKLLLKADEQHSSFLVKVQGQAAYETPVWRINEIYDLVVDPLDRGDSGFAGLE